MWHDSLSFLGKSWRHPSRIESGRQLGALGCRMNDNRLVVGEPFRAYHRLLWKLPSSKQCRPLSRVLPAPRHVSNTQQSRCHLLCKQLEVSHQHLRPKACLRWEAMPSQRVIHLTLGFFKRMQKNTRFSHQNQGYSPQNSLHRVHSLNGFILNFPLKSRISLVQSVTYPMKFARISAKFVPKIHPIRYPMNHTPQAGFRPLSPNK